MSEFIEINGKYNKAKVFNPNIDEASYQQIETMMDRKEFEGSKFRFMPDVHYGKGSTVGTTMTIEDKVVPNFIGVDIGCGVNVTELGINKKEASEKDFLKRFDRLVRGRVPLGFKRHKSDQKADLVDHEEFLVSDQLERETFYESIGSLGGGNHFISLEANDSGKVYLLIHSGSRNIGYTVANIYQDMANQTNPSDKSGGGHLEGELFDQYLHDLKLGQKYALQNRNAMADNILEAVGIKQVDRFDTAHNYIDLDDMIARKGAISAKKGEKIIIPFNSRDGSVIAEGKGNPDWNYSAPHGAGRVMSRTKAKKKIPYPEYQKMMEDVYSSSVNKSTLDEAPAAYNKQREILNLAKDTIQVLEYIRPIYNLKA
ncbi:MAG: RtcB family protein [Atopostipes sp.]|nr:RtcB family protein [Atopostipes sp.]